MTVTTAHHEERSLSSTGLHWDIPRLHKRYAFLRKLKETVAFRLLYYPYWFLHFSESITWPVLGTKYVDQLRIMDGRTGRSFKLISSPETAPERTSPQGTAEGHFVLTQVARGEQILAQAEMHTVAALVGEEEALQRGEHDAQRELGRFYNRPLGFMAEIKTKASEALLLYKPFWIMRPLAHCAPEKQRIFVFDASTGLGGTAEYWNIVEYMFALEEKHLLHS